MSDKFNTKESDRLRECIFNLMSARDNFNRQIEELERQYRQALVDEVSEEDKEVYEAMEYMFKRQ